jgi:tRNA(fMet)-specific endonuclease VapC
MNGSLLDTNVITKLLDKDPAAITLVQKVEDCFTSSVVVGELYYAAANSSRQEANLKAFREALSCIDVISIDDDVCISYANIKIRLKRIGKPIPENDIWIAACALTHKLSVATFDKHFSEIAGLEVVSIEA